MRIYKNKNQLLIICLAVGFLIGIIYQNIVSGRQAVVAELFLKANLQLYLQTDIITPKYLWYVLKERVLLFGIICVLGCMRWKKVFVMFFLLLVGFLAGVLTVSAVLQLGIKGILLCVIGIFPQGIFYGVTYCILLPYWYRFPERRWNRVKTGFVIVMLLVGVLTEVYVNPVLVKWVIKTLLL